jgi:TRAP-type C4-dicarboxylate transport system permease small subunit
MKAVERLLKWMEIPIHVLLWGGLIAGFLMMIHVSIDVTARTVFNNPFAGTTEIVSGWYMVAVAYLPWAWITQTNNHIVAGVFERIGSERFGYWVEIAVKMFMLFYVSVFTWQTWLRAVQQTQAGEVWEAAGGFIPIWPSRWMLPIAAGLMAIYLVLRIVSDIGRGLTTHGEAQPREGGI